MSHISPTIRVCFSAEVVSDDAGVTTDPSMSPSMHPNIILLNKIRQIAKILILFNFTNIFITSLYIFLLFEMLLPGK